MEYVRRILESGHERGRILSFDAKPEPGIVAEIGTGFVVFNADQANTYVVGAEHNTALFILGLAPASSGCDDISGTQWNCHAEIANVEEAAPICRETRVN